MDLGIGSCVLRLIVLLLFISAIGCEENPPKPAEPTSPAKQETVAQSAGAQSAGQGTKSAETAPRSPDKNAAPAGGDSAQKAGEGSAKTAAGGLLDPKAAGAISNEARSKLAKAYLEIYCAQRKQETEKLLEIYTRYGFEEPKAWTEAWTEAAEDHAWVAQITQDAIRTCP
jgi:hypothetical protein